MGVRGRGRGPRRYVLKADPSRQWRLLDLQAIDTRLDQIAHAKKTLPQQAQLEDLQTQSDLLDSELVRARTELSDIQREVAKAEADVQLVRERAARDQARLDSGTGTAKDLQAIQHELQSLARRQSELEDVEIEIMERAEAVESEVARLEGKAGELTTRLQEVDGRAGRRPGRPRGRGAQGRRPTGRHRRRRRRGPRGALREGPHSSGGLGAAALRQRRCGGCQLELNNVDMNRIKAAPDDEVLRCEECRRILVRTAESGL